MKTPCTLPRLRGSKALLIPLLALGCILKALADPLIPPSGKISECMPRQGLPNVLSKLSSGKEVRIAFLGGSITEADGWSRMLLEMLHQKFPNPRIIPIKAGVGGTGAEYGCCRLEQEVLANHPDLVFVEFAVNGAGKSDSRVIQTMEGIARKVIRADPTTDICFVYTIAYDTKSLEEGIIPKTNQLMDRVADHYGIPSFELGVPVAELHRKGRLVMRNWSPVTKPEDVGKILFTKDGVHPTEPGHRIYAECIMRGIDLMTSGSLSHSLPPPLDLINWEQATITPPDRLSSFSGFEPYKPADPMRWAHLRYHRCFKGNPLGNSLTFDFEGTTFGLQGGKASDSPVLTLAIDGKSELIAPFNEQGIAAGDAWLVPWFYPSDLSSGHHHVEISSHGPLILSGIMTPASITNSSIQQ